MNVANDINMLRKLINTEEKHVDSLMGVITVLVAGPGNVQITTCAEGDDNNQRNGRSIKVFRFDLMMRFQWNGGTATVQANNHYRWFLVRWNRVPTGGVGGGFAVADFVNTDYSGTNYTPLSLPNTDNSQAFQILAEGLVQMPEQALQATTVERIVNITHQCSFHQTFNGSSTANLNSNSVQLVVLSMNNAAAGGVSQFEGCCRMWFIDN